jgi:cyclase
LLHDGQVYKTVNFKDPTYVGDPLNAVRIFNEKKVDELFVFDIDATPQNLSPNFDLIRKISRECEMPLTYAGGIKSVEMAEKIISLGVEKIGIGNYAITNPNLIPKICTILGSQSVAGIVNFMKNQDHLSYSVYSSVNGLEKNLNALDYAVDLVEQGVGEIVLNSVDNDGCMKGYDTEFLKLVVEKANCVVTILGGAGSLEHLVEAINSVDIKIGLAAGSLFTYRGKFRSVLFSYLSTEDKKNISEKIYLS